MILSGQSIRDLSFACLIAEIDGEKYEDLSPEGLQKVLELLGGTARKVMTDEYQAVKKKIDEELILYYPSLFNDVQTREYYDTLKMLVVAQLEGIIEEREDKEREERLRERLVLFQKPKVYTGHDGLEVKHDKEFETMCLTITSETGWNAKEMTTLEYYNAYEYLREKSRKAQNKAR